MKNLTKEQVSIMEHTRDRTAGGLYCGDSSDMRVLVEYGYMESAGFKSFVPSEYFRLTELGNRYLNGSVTVYASGVMIGNVDNTDVSVTDESSDSIDNTDTSDWSGDGGSFAGGGASGSWDE